MVGDNIAITILEVRGDIVRVGIDAPRDVKVHRAELLAELEQTNKQAASPTDDIVASLRESLARRKNS